MYEPDIVRFPDWFQQKFAKLTPLEQRAWKDERARAMADHMAMGALLEMDFQEDPHRLLFNQFLQKKPDSGLVLSDLDTLTKKFMILWPRGLFKTSAVIVDIIQNIVNYPNIRICFMTGSDMLAMKQLARVKKVFERPSKRFLQLFPDFCGIDYDKNGKMKYVKLGNKHAFTVPSRNNDSFAEETFQISTAKSVKSGAHFDLIYIDDLVNDQNYKSITALDKCFQEYLDICPMLEPTGFIIMTGTRYSFGDTYERIQEKSKLEEKAVGRTVWKFSIRDCWSLGCKCGHSDVYHNKDINIAEPPCVICDCKGFQPTGVKGVLFPEARTKDGRAIGHSLEYLEGKRVELGPEFFANQYENSPMASGTQTFTEVLICAQTLHHDVQIPPYNQAYTFVVGDLAYVGADGRDYSVLYICRLFQGQIFVFRCEFGTWDSGQVAENIVNVLLKERPNIIYLEKFPAWESYNNVITTYANMRGIQKIPIVWEKCSNVANAKLIRIGAIKGVLASKRLWLYQGMKGYEALVEQLLKWPKLGRHDDFADCIGMVVAAPTGYQLENPPQAVSMQNWLRKYNEAPVDTDSYLDNGCGNGLVC